MDRMEAITRLRDSADAVRTMGATSLYLFGSTARDEARADSDLDLFIDYDPASRFNAFDLVGERKIVNFERDDRAEWMKETIEITVKNRSKEPKEIIVREHLWRWMNWTIENASMEPVKKDAQKVEFTVKLAPDEEKKVTFTAHYTW